MELRPFLSFFGSKWRTAHLYPKPEHSTIVEPFAGGAGYALRYPDRNVILVERDPVVYGVWDYLIHTSPEEIRSLPDVGRDETLDDLHVCQEARWLIGFWLGNSARPSKKMTSRAIYGIERGWSNFWCPRLRERIASQTPHIQHWKVFNHSYADIQVSRAATWFVDPPYQVKGVTYTFGSKKINFEHLAGWCRDRKGQVIVCENVGAEWLPFRHLADTHNTQNKFSAEAIWVQA